MCSTVAASWTLCYYGKLMRICVCMSCARELRPLAPSRRHHSGSYSYRVQAEANPTSERASASEEGEQDRQRNRLPADLCVCAIQPCFALLCSSSYLSSRRPV